LRIMCNSSLGVWKNTCLFVCLFIFSVCLVIFSCLFVLKKKKKLLSSLS
jgi:hypothetical protein